MVDQQELHHATLRVNAAARFSEYLHAVSHRRGAGRKWLGRLLNVDQTHPTAGRDRQLVVVAETGNVDPGPVGHLDDHLALAGGQLVTVDLDGDGVGLIFLCCSHDQSVVRIQGQGREDRCPRGC